MKAPKPPPVPDPLAMGSAQSMYNIQDAIAQARLNDVNQETPYGTVTYAFGQPAGVSQKGAGAATRQQQQQPYMVG